MAYRQKDSHNREEGSVPEMQGQSEDSLQDAKKRAKDRTQLDFQGQSEDSLQDVKKRTKERVQLDFSPDALYRLDQLKAQLDAGTRAEVIRLALRLLEWFATEVPEDATITVTGREEKLIAMFKAKLLYGYGSKE
jgi:hypothetical protein